ncbi:DNA-directed RNA polymerase subunit omega [bacterium]|nr:DNA-directed RNA polymerase subunit omega [bacterium]
MVKKLSLENLIDHTGNIYEAVCIMAKRARQVNDAQKQVIDQDREYVPVVENREGEDFEEIEIDHEALLRDYKKYPKPTRVAIEEMAEKKVHYKYKTDEE